MADREGVRHHDEATIRLARRCGNDTFKFGHIMNRCDNRSGHAVSAPSEVMNSRRLMSPPNDRASYR
jgi:hypothetical protein